MLQPNTYGAAEAGMKAQKAAGRGARRSRGRSALAPLLAIVRLFAPLLLVLLALGSGVALAADKAQILVTEEQGFGRLVVGFPDRLDLPAYRVKYENGVLAIEFDNPIDILLPDIAVLMPNYATVARADPDGKGIRIGLRNGFNLSRLEAGEKLYIDLLPLSWQGLPPSLPPEVVAELSQRAKEAAQLAEQMRRAEEAKVVHPVADVRLGKNPTFTRLEFDWSADTKANYTQDGNVARVTFDWPVPVDVSTVSGDLPAEIKSIKNDVTPQGTTLTFTLADGVTPRFYGQTPQQFTLDVDLPGSDVQNKVLAAADLAKLASENGSASDAASQGTGDGTVVAEGQDAGTGSSGPVVPKVEDVSGTVRVSFPFDRDTASAAFRRGDTLWLVFDTPSSIEPPEMSDALSSIASGVAVIPAGETQIVKVDLSTEKLASLASEGRSWVLSLGDVLLNTTEPVELRRSRDQSGRYEMAALLGKPAKVHSFRDPDVGDTLDIVTAFPPSRGTLRDLSYVDFDALRTIQGLVLRPDNADLEVAISGDRALITAPEGLTLSDQSTQRIADASDASQFRESYVNFAVLHEPDQEVFSKHVEQLSSDAALKEGQAQEVARLTLAQYYVGNQFAYEALGVLNVLSANLKTQELNNKVQLTSAIADVLAYRPKDALAILGGDGYNDQIDALMWRAIARVDSFDYANARADALAAEPVAASYPVWLQERFYFAAIRAAVETNDIPTAQRLLKKIDFTKLAPEDVSLYQLMQGRIAEGTGSVQEALDTYGQVISSDVRPTRAEAVYRTLLLLKQTGKIDLNKATNTLAAEAMLWRGDPLEVSMDKLLAELYFANHQYRQGFEIAKQVGETDPDSPAVAELADETAQQFSELFLNGAADQLNDVDALSLFYDFRTLTPPGAKGDEMIRNLAQRLVKVDLLDQAANLLQYQVDSRLTGVAKSQVAADLALIRISNRDPQGALHALTQSDLANLPPDLDRERRILQARALIDADRGDMALDLLSRVSGHDADQLRVDAYWKAKNYAASSNAIETMYSDDNTEQLPATARVNLIKAAVGLVLTNDTIGLARLRSKFAGRLSQTPEWPMFDYLTGTSATVDGQEFKAAAKQVADIDQINAFLDSYRQSYGTAGGVMPAQAAPKPAG